MFSMGCFVFLAWCVGREVESFGGNREEVLDDKEDDVDELDEEDVVEEVSDSESSPSKGLVTFCFKDGNTVGSRTGRPGISNEGLWDLLRFRWRVILDSHTIWECQIESQKIHKEKLTKLLYIHFDVFYMR